MIGLKNENREDVNQINHISFNQDCSCFSVGTETGFYVFDSCPLRERFRREFGDGGLGAVEMLHRCNILALVGGGSNPKYPKDTVVIWDDYQVQGIAQLPPFGSEVKSVRLRRDRYSIHL
eukprot:TRINITY_DN998_c0_g1_i2.p1 TRINITY_DN998_c0_g1~~TRINITY_DN998_c0_g1_i2.p1  ORF type:complete len:120 (-),score=15.52 TRINITY_DN998_c0_g1_i2:797-1156(-)